MFGEDIFDDLDTVASTMTGYLPNLETLPPKKRQIAERLTNYFESSTTNALVGRT